MTINLSNISPGLIAIFTLLFSSPVLVTMINFLLFKRKNSAEADSAILKNMQVLIDAYKDNKELDDERKKELQHDLLEARNHIRQSNEQQTQMMKQQSALLDQHNVVNKKLEDINHMHNDCMKEHRKALDQIAELKQELGINK